MVLKRSVFIHHLFLRKVIIKKKIKQIKVGIEEELSTPIFPSEVTDNYQPSSFNGYYVLVWRIPYTLILNYENNVQAVHFLI